MVLMAIGGDAEGLVDVSKDRQHERLQKMLERCELLTLEGDLVQIGTMRGLSVSEIEYPKSREFVSTLQL